VVEVRNDHDYTAVVKKAAEEGKLSVIDFTAKWCGPCRVMAPIFETLSNQHTNVKFVRVDIDNEDLTETITQNLITQVPTFKFVKNMETIESFSGADKRRLEEYVLRLAKNG